MTGRQTETGRRSQIAKLLNGAIFVSVYCFNLWFTEMPCTEKILYGIFPVKCRGCFGGLSCREHREVGDRAVQSAGHLPEQKTCYDFNLHSQQCKSGKSQ